MSGNFSEALRDSFTAPAGVVRVLVVGDTGVGKTSLVHLITEGQPISRPRVTAGCNVSVKHLEYNSANLGSDDSSKRAFFIELWDVTGAPQYHAARSIFYQRINGVIGVHDLTNRRTRSNLHRWASEVASLGSFSAPSPASPFEGGLPVPFLTVGNKSDSKRWDNQGGGKMPLPSSPLKRVATRLGSMAEQLEARLGAFSDDESAAPLTKKATKWAAKLGEYVNGGPNGHELPRSDSISSWSGLLTSAKTGRIDVGAVNAFFYELIRRRYFASEIEARPSSIQYPPIFPSLASGSNLDRLDDSDASGSTYDSTSSHFTRQASETQMTSSSRDSPYSLPPPPGRIRVSSSSEMLNGTQSKGPEPTTVVGADVPKKSNVKWHKSLPVDPG